MPFNAQQMVDMTLETEAYLKTLSREDLESFATNMWLEICACWCAIAVDGGVEPDPPISAKDLDEHLLR